MSRPGVRTRGNFAQDTLTAELTTGQIVIMACGALAVACTMFALGVLVGRYDMVKPPSTTVADAAAAPKPEPAPTAPAVVVANKQKAEPEPVPAKEEKTLKETPAPEPAPSVAAVPEKKPEAHKPEETKPDAAKSEEKPVETVVATAQTANPGSGTGTLGDTVKPRVTRVEPLPPVVSGNNTAAQVTELKPADMPAAEKAVEKVSEKPVTPKITPSEPAAAGKTKPVSEEDGPSLMEKMPEPAAKAGATKVADAKQPSAAKPADATKPASAAKADTKPPTGKFGIQIGSFKGSAGAAKAQDYAKRVKATSGYDARVSRSEDGQVYRVVIGGYADKSAATEACNKLKGVAGFKDAFVKPL